MAGHQNLSLKTKSILWILGLVFVLSGLSLIAFGFLRSSVNDLSAMIDTTVTAHELKILAGTVTEGLPVEIEAYALHPTKEAKDKILAAFTRIDRQIDLLEAKITDEEGKVQLSLVKNMFRSSAENFSEILKMLDRRAAFGEINDLIATIKESSGLIGESVQRLLSIELTLQQAEKSDLSKRIDRNGYLLSLTIALSGIVGMLFFYISFMKRSIFLPLNNMKSTMSKIASDVSDIKLRVRVEREDEIGTLAEFFNKMADTIQKYNENLESLVETRTRQLNEAQSMLVQSGKLSALGEMAGGVAHEINNPLTIIQLKSQQLCELAQDGSLDKDMIKESAEKIGQIVDRIAKIVKGLRSFSRDARNDPYEIARIKEIVENSLSLCQEKFKSRGVEMRVSEIPSDNYIECRPTELSQVLLNLLNNASDAIENLEDRWIDLQVSDNGPELKLSIMDSGKGIPEAVQNKIFQPFFTTKGIGKGTGLGLSISKGIIESLGGTIEIDKNNPHTCFVITLPKSQTSA